MKLAIAVLFAAVATLGLVSIAQAQEPTVDDVKAKFAGLSQSDVEALGYEQITDCLDASELPPSVLEELDIPATAGMGIHFLNEALVDTTLDPLEPELIQFGPGGEVWNVEYATPPQEDPLEIFGQQLSFVEEADIDALHLWMVDNPAGQFADFNANVSCPAELPSTGGPPPAPGSDANWWLVALGAALAAGGLGLVTWRLRRQPH